MWFGILEVLLPVLILLCMYIPSFVLEGASGGNKEVRAAVSVPREIMDVRWTQSEGAYCMHLFSGPQAIASGGGHAVPTKIAYVDEGDPIEDEVVHRAVAQLLCSTTNATDFPLKNLTADSAPLPAAFLAALGLGDLSEPRRFSFLDVVFACHNLNTLDGKLSEALESGDGSLPSRDELLLAPEAASLEAALFGSSGLEEILDNLRWRRSEDVLSVPSLACDEDCLQDVECLRPLLGDLLLEFGDVDEALEYARARPEEVMAVVEPGPQQDPFGDSGEFRYTIYVDAGKIPDLKEKYTNWAVDSIGGMDKWKNYFVAANIQSAMDNAVGSVFRGGIGGVVPRYATYPVPAHENPFQGWISGLILPNILVFSFVPAVALQMQFLLYDKHLKLQQYTALGEVNRVLHSALLCTLAFVPYVVLALIACLVLSYVYPLASMSLVYVVFLIWFASLCVFNALVGTFFSSSVLASIAVVVAYVMFWIPGLLTCNIMRSGSVAWLAVSIFPPSSLYVFGIMLSYFEQIETGLTWENVRTNIIEENGLGHVSCSSLMYVISSSILLFGLGVLVDDFGGISRLWQWGRDHFTAVGAETSRIKDVDQVEGAYEVATARRVAAIEFLGIKKSYGKTKAVRNFSMKVYQGTLTILLGHNGAGKTTLMSILSGALSPTAGVLKIFGEDCVSNKMLCKNLGVCQQLDFLWPTLTVAEHVILIQRLKGIRCKVASEAALAMLEELQMHSCLNLATKSLSGGQKRKLSLVLSFIGNPRIILLDEPTAGMDSVSRRTVWHFLKTRQEATIFMTTHLMDEADTLGDKVAIMSKGELLCYGSGSFLKLQYAAGYRVLLSGKSSLKDETLGDKIKKYFPGQSLPHMVSGKSMVLYLPVEQTGSIPAFLDSLWKRSVAHRISVSAATLNDVFLKTLPREKPKSKTSRKRKVRAGGSDKSARRRAILCTLLWKHLLTYIRSRHLIVTSMVIPIAFVAIGILLLQVLLSKTISGGLELSGMYLGAPNKPVQLISNDPAAFSFSAWDGGVELQESQLRLESVKLEPGSSWQSYLLRTNPGINASCGDPRNSLTCASLILDEAESSALGGEEGGFGGTPHEFATSRTALHGIPAALNVLNNLFLTNDNGGVLQKISTFIAPIGKNAVSGWHTLAVIMNFSSASFMLAICCCGASFGVKPAWERQHNCKIIQRVLGVSRPQYWFSQLVFDLVVYFIFGAAVLVVVYALPARTLFVYPDAILGLSLVILASGPAVIQLSYIFEGLFKSDFLCFGSLFASRAFVGIVFLEVGVSLTVLESRGHGAAAAANDILRWVLPLLPEYSVARTFYDIVDSNFKGTQLSLRENQGQALLFFVFFSVANSVLYSAIFWLIEAEVFQWIFIRAAPTSAAVAPVSNKILHVSRIHYRFQGKNKETGLYNINLSLHKKGTLGLVGPCGSGKSTLLKILAGVLKPTEGTITRMHSSGGCEKSSLFLKKSGFITGYCPQSGGLFPTLTVGEHMHFYSQLWSTRKWKDEGKDQDQDQESYLSMLGLKRHSSKQAHTLSEGNKRKLIVAIALSSPSDVILLDEPSAGVDPEGQIRIANCIRKASKTKSIVLCSHAMEECESLCSRVALLHSGHLSSVQTLEQLKCSSYDRALRLSVKPGDTHKGGAADALWEVFPGAERVKASSDWIQVRLAGPEGERSERPGFFGGVFKGVQELIRRGVITDFRISEMGIEDILLEEEGEWGA